MQCRSICRKPKDRMETVVADKKRSRTSEFACPRKKPKHGEPASLPDVRDLSEEICKKTRSGRVFLEPVAKEVADERTKDVWYV